MECSNETALKLIANCLSTWTNRLVPPLRLGVEAKRREPNDFTTNRTVLEYAGCLYDGHAKKLFIAIFRLYFLTFGWIQYGCGILMATEDESILKTVECIHWMIVFISVDIMAINSLLYSKKYVKMESIIKSGFYNYEGQLNEKQLNMRADTDEIIRKVISWSKIVFIVALVGSYVKAPLFMGGFKMPFPLWFPWVIDSWPRYLVCMAYMWFVCESMVTCSATNLFLFITLAGHLDAQIRVLKEGVRSLDVIGQDKGLLEQEALMHGRIKSCVQHQRIIIDFFTDLQQYYNWPLLVTAFSMGLILCTLGYIVISPESTLPQIASFTMVLIPEMGLACFYSAIGQRIADMSSQVCDEVYNLEWYLRPVRIQKELLLLMVGSKKQFQFTGYGLHQFSYKGLSEILQASFTYFNMLNALSSGT